MVNPSLSPNRVRYVYLADKTGRLLAKGGPARYAALEWVFFNAGGTGPMFGQLGYYNKFLTRRPFAIERCNGCCECSSTGCALPRR
jgi:GST-like protein